MCCPTDCDPNWNGGPFPCGACEPMPSTRFSRIKLLWQIYCLWSYFPSLRLCQLLVNTTSEVDRNVRDNPCTLFYIDDQTVSEGITEFRKDYV